MNKLVLLSGLAAMIFFASCGKKDEKSEGLKANSPILSFAFPNDKVPVAVAIGAIPAGTYKLKKITNKHLSSNPNVVNFGVEHALKTPGVFVSGDEGIRFEADYKDTLKPLKPGEYMYNYEEMNLAFEIQATGVTATLADTHYYFNRPQSNSPTTIAWHAQTDKVTTRGYHFLDVFTSGVRNPQGAYDYGFGFSNVKGRGLVFMEGSDVHLVVEHITDPDAGFRTERVIEYVYAR